MNRLGTGAHDHDHAFGIGSADVIKQLVLTAGQLGELIHGLLDNAGAGIIKLIHRLTTLEIHIGVLGGAANPGTVRRQGALTVLEDHLVGHHGMHHLIREGLNLLDFMGGPEAIEEVDKRHAGVKGRSLGDQGKVLGFLHTGGGQHGKPGLPDGHHVRVITEDGQALTGQRAGGDMKDGAGELTGNLVHVRDHQEQAL